MRSSSCSRSCFRRFSSSSRASFSFVVGLGQVVARLGPLVLVEVAGGVLFVRDGLADVLGPGGLRAWRRAAGWRAAGWPAGFGCRTASRRSASPGSCCWPGRRSSARRLRRRSPSRRPCCLPCCAVSAGLLAVLSRRRSFGRLRLGAAAVLRRTALAMPLGPVRRRAALGRLALGPVALHRVGLVAVRRARRPSGPWCLPCARPASSSPSFGWPLSPPLGSPSFGDRRAWPAPILSASSSTLLGQLLLVLRQLLRVALAGVGPRLVDVRLRGSGCSGRRAASRGTPSRP